MADDGCSPYDWRRLFGPALGPELFRALGDPNRLALLARLATAGEPLTVTEAGDCCGVHISGVSRHLAILRTAGLVRADKRGREVRYSVDFDRLTTALGAFADTLERCRRREHGCGGGTRRERE